MNYSKSVSKMKYMSVGRMKYCKNVSRMKQLFSHQFYDIFYVLGEMVSVV
jgi:hypothetical protein